MSKEQIEYFEYFLLWNKIMEIPNLSKLKLICFIFHFELIHFRLRPTKIRAINVVNLFTVYSKFQSNLPCMSFYSWQLHK